MDSSDIYHAIFRYDFDRAGEGGDLVSWTVAERVNFGHNVMDSSDMMQSSAMISTVDETRGGP